MNNNANPNMIQNQNENITPEQNVSTNTNQNTTISEQINLNENQTQNKNTKTIIIVSVAMILLVVLIFICFKIFGKEKTFEVIFEDGYGKILETQTVKEKEKVKKPTDPTKEGYIFVEWTNQNKTYDFNLEVISDMTLKATWEKTDKKTEKYTVKFDSDEGTTISNQIIAKGKKATKPKEPKKEGYVFKGWYLEEEEYDFEKEVTKNITLKAKWEKEQPTEQENNSNNENNQPQEEIPIVKPISDYTITFNTDGGSEIASQTIKKGQTVTKPENPTKKGYIFKGWYLDTNEYNFSQKVTKNITLVAKWEKNETKPVAKYTITFNTDGGSAISSQTVEEGKTAIQPSNPTKEGYNFAGWTLNGNTYDFSSSVTGNIILIAKWTQKTYSVVANKVDQLSTGRTLSAYEDGNLISVQEFKYSDGSSICYGSSPNVDYYALAGETTIKIVLSNGTIVTASLTIN